MQSGAQDRAAPHQTSPDQATPDEAAPDQATPHQAALEELMRASRLLTAVVAHSLAERDASISVPQLRVLVMLSATDRLNVTAVAESLGVVASNASRTCDRLVAAGLVDRSEDEVDRRSVLFTLSTAGKSLVAALMDSRRAVLEDVVREMRPADCRRLAEGLQAFRSAAARVDADGTLARAEGHFLHWV